MRRFLNSGPTGKIRARILKLHCTLPADRCVQIYVIFFYWLNSINHFSLDVMGPKNESRAPYVDDNGVLEVGPVLGYFFQNRSLQTGLVKRGFFAWVLCRCFNRPWLRPVTMAPQTGHGSGWYLHDSSWDFFCCRWTLTWHPRSKKYNDLFVFIHIAILNFVFLHGW